MLVGFNVETVEYKNISFTVWDVGGQVSSDHNLIYLENIKIKSHITILG